MRTLPRARGRAQAAERALRRLARRRLPPQPARRRRVLLSGTTARARRASCGCSTRRIRSRSSCEQAGGAASDGTTRILDVQPTELHQRTPLFIGSEGATSTLATCETLGGSRRIRASSRATRRRSPTLVWPHARRTALALGHPGRPGLPSRRRARRLRARSRRSRARSRSRAACSRRCTAAGSGPCASTPASARRAETNARFRHAARRRARRDCPSRSICRRRWASTPIRRARSAKSGASASRSTRSRTCTRSSTRSPLDRVSTSMTINATAATLLAMYIVVAEERGIARARARRHDPERHPQGVHRARHVHLSARRRRLALITEIFRFCAAEVPQLEPDLDLRLPHPRGRVDGGAGARVHLRERDGVRAARARDAGLAVDDFAPRLSFFFAAHNDLFEEVAKFRAARRMYARLMRERFGASDASCRLRFHTQTGGVTLTAQQPLNNVVRVTVQALAAVLGGTQSLHTNGYDEALALPTAEAATLALRTQQIVAIRERRRRHGRSARRQLLRRAAHRRSWSAQAMRAPRAGRRARRRGPRDRGRVLPGGDRAAARTSTSCASSAARR